MFNVHCYHLFEPIITENDVYSLSHGMSCISNCKLRKNITILLFGNMYNINQPSNKSFTKLSINYNCNLSNKNNKWIDNCNIIENKIQIKCDQNIFSCNNYWFGYNSVINEKNERIIIIIGGRNYSKDISLFNCVTNELIIKKNVSLCLNCFFCVVTSQ